jgi:hypothetical protein
MRITKQQRDNLIDLHSSIKSKAPCAAASLQYVIDNVIVASPIDVKGAEEKLRPIAKVYNKVLDGREVSKDVLCEAIEYAFYI